MELVDLVPQRYGVTSFEGKIPTVEPVDVQTKGSAKSYDLSILAKFDDGNDCLLMLTVDGIMGKCTCVKYGDTPCEHLVAAFQKFREIAGEDTISKLSRIEKKGEKGVRREQTKEKTEKSKSSGLKDRFLNKLTVLFGQPLTGKTTFAMHLAKEFSRVAVIKVDKNYSVEDYGINARVFPVSRPRDVLDAISQIPAYEDQLVIVDSITSLDAYFMPEEPEKDDPRVANRRARFCDAVMMGLQKFRKGGAVLVIAHEAIKDFQTKEVGPRMNVIALRHADQVLRLTVENGKRKITRVNVRKVVENPEFEFEW